MPVRDRSRAEATPLSLHPWALQLLEVGAVQAKSTQGMIAALWIRMLACAIGRKTLHDL